MAGGSGPWWRTRQADVRARRRRLLLLLLGRRWGWRIEGHGGVLRVALLPLDQVGVSNSMCAGARARGAGRTPRREESKVRAGAAQGREERA
jgi:hypothetical protein